MTNRAFLIEISFKFPYLVKRCLHVAPAQYHLGSVQRLTLNFSIHSKVNTRLRLCLEYDFILI